MQKKLSEIQVIPIKPIDGLVGFASVVFDNSFYLSGIGIYTRPVGDYRLSYPTRKSSAGSLHIFHPISKAIAEDLENAITEKFRTIVTSN